MTKDSLFELIAEECLLDGRIDEVENILLKRVAKFLRLKNDKAREILIHAKKLFKEGKLGEQRQLHGLELYRKALAVAAADGRADKLEATMLQGLRNVLSISEADHKKAIADLKNKITKKNKKEKVEEKVAPIDVPAIVKNPFRELKSRKTHASLWLNISDTLGCRANLKELAKLANEKAKRKRYLAIDCLWLHLAQALRERDSEEFKKLVDASSSFGQFVALEDAMSSMTNFHDGGCKSLLAKLSAHAPLQGKTKASLLSPRLEKEVSRYALEEAALILAGKEDIYFVRNDVAVAQVIARPKNYPRPLLLLKNVFFPRAWLNVEIDKEARMLTVEDVNFDGDLQPKELEEALAQSDGAYDVCLVNEQNTPWRIWFQSGNIDPTGLVTQAQDAMQGGDYAQTQDLLAKASEKCQWQSKALVYLAQVKLFTTSDTSGAKVAAEQALMRQPFDPNCAAIMGDVLDEQELLNQAVDYYERALAIFPNKEKWLRTMVKICHRAQDEDLLYWLAALRECVGRDETATLALWENIDEATIKELSYIQADPTHRLRS